MDASALITELLPALNAATTADLVWWSTDDLYGFADEAAKRLMRTTGVFARVDTGTVATAEVSTEPAHPVIHASWNGISLRAATVRELEALDSNWLNTTGTPKKWTQDLGLGQIRVYPAPSVAGTLERVAPATPATIASGTPLLEAPLAAESYFYAAVLASARSAEGEAQMLDLAAHLETRLKFFEQVFRAYYSGAA